MVCPLLKKYLHMKRMLKMNRYLYTDGNFKQNVGENRLKIGDLIFLLSYFEKKSAIYYHLLLLLIGSATIARTNNVFAFRRCWLIERWYDFKNEASFLNAFT